MTKPCGCYFSSNFVAQILHFFRPRLISSPSFYFIPQYCIDEISHQCQLMLDSVAFFFFTFFLNCERYFIRIVILFNFQCLQRFECNLMQCNLVAKMFKSPSLYRMVSNGVHIMIIMIVKSQKMFKNLNLALVKWKILVSQWSSMNNRTKVLDHRLLHTIYLQMR